MKCVFWVNHTLFWFFIRLIQNSVKSPESEKDHPSFSANPNESSQDHCVGKSVAEDGNEGDFEVGAVELNRAEGERNFT